MITLTGLSIRKLPFPETPAGMSETRASIIPQLAGEYAYEQAIKE